jgi:DNA ligase (NAD+)
MIPIIMDKNEVKKRIEKLKKVVRYHRYLCHVLDKQEISEAALDSLKHELYLLEQEYPEFITDDSPTQRVGGDPLEKFSKVEHNLPMLSIEDVFSLEEVEKWEDYLLRLSPEFNKEYFCELKIDGFAVSLIYIDGVLKQAATRGNGKVGEDVTNNVKGIGSIPLNISFEEKNKELISGRVEVRGEVYMTKKVFDEINKEREKKGEELYANPRNTAAGSIRNLDPKITVSRSLDFLAYDLIIDSEVKKHAGKHEILALFGFKTDKFARVCNNLPEIDSFWREVLDRRGELPFLIDGIVINVNDNKLFKSFGVAGKSPRGIRAFKFAAEQGTTVVEGITLQVGRTGAVTPVAELRPVQIAGAIISRATLHNKDEMEKLDLMIGDTVIVERAGDVIPAVVEVLKELRIGKEEKFIFPKNCPICGSELFRPEEEIIYRCLNKSCRAIHKESLYHFVSKKGFNIDGLGPKLIDKLMDEGLVSSFPDIFKLREGDLVTLERFAEKSASNLISSISNSKEIPLGRLIFSLGIRFVGEETSEDLAQYFKSLELLKKASIEDLEGISDIGTRTSESLSCWLREKENLTLLDELISVGVKIITPKEKKDTLAGKSFAITGIFVSFSRNEAEKAIRNLGGDPVGSVSKKTSYLVLGKNPGSKHLKAKKLGISILDEKEFLKIIGKK